MKFANKNNIHISESGIQDVKNDQNWNENTHRVLSRSSRQSPRTGSALVSSKLRAKSKEMKRRKVAAFKKVSNCDDDGSSEDEDEDEINAYAFLGVNVNDNDHLESNQNTKSRRCKRKLSRIIAPMSNTLILQRELHQFDAKMRDKERVMSFKEAISSYSARAKFVKESSSKCVIVLVAQLMSLVICFVLNTYVFLFSPVRRYLHVWHSIIPLLVMMYPLCCAAWVTKQYNWFIIVVVKAWVHRNDLDDDSDSSNAGDSGIDGMSTSQATSQGRFSKLFQGQFFKKKVNSDMSQSSVSIHQLPRSQSSELNKSNKKTLRRLSTGNIKDKLKNVTSLFPWQKEASVSNNNNTNTTKPSTGLGKLLDTVIAAKAVSKFKSVVKKPRFNFEKFLSYLESMRNVVGFNIAGVMITWDKVSTTLFLLFSIIAVFVQESIFGSKKSTL